MPTIIARHKVGNFTTWINGHQDRVELFKTFATSFQEFQDTDDPKSVLIVFDVFDVDAMNALMTNPEVIEKIAKEKHTVIEPIIVSMPV